MRKKVLVVEGNDLNMKLFYELLIMRGYDIIQTSDGIEVLSLAREEKPDLILMNIQLLGVSGPEVIQRLKEGENLKHIPIIIASSYYGEGDKEKILAMGCKACITIPISVDNFYNVIESFIGKPDLIKHENKTDKPLIHRKQEQQDIKKHKITAEKNIAEDSEVQYAISEYFDISNYNAKKILVIKDNDLNMKLFCDLFNAHSYDTIQTQEGIEALSLAREKKPDLILIDIQLPEVSGLEVIKRLREDEELWHIPIIAVTAFAIKGDEEKILTGGCEAYISKPISVADFIETVKKVADFIETVKKYTGQNVVAKGKFQKFFYEISKYNTKKILVVKDNDLNMKLFFDLLRAHGYDTIQT